MYSKHTNYMLQIQDILNYPSDYALPEKRLEVLEIIRNKKIDGEKLPYEKTYFFSRPKF